MVESSSGKKAFLKALDYSRALGAPDPAKELQSLTEAFNFERDLLNKCRDSRMTKVVLALGDGKVAVSSDPIGVVQYLIFELADGDVRTYLDFSDKFDLAWVLRSLHHVAVGLNQLHGAGIAHQDLKPSNILVFKGNSSKLSDLGRAAYKNRRSPHDGYKIAGDLSYAPPELLYGYVDSDWSVRRYGCDAYLLGSMVVFFFTGTAVTPLWLSEMREEHQYRNWGGTFLDVLPYVKEAFGKVVDSFGTHVPSSLSRDLVEIVRQLCEPDPYLRGHPRNRGEIGNPYSLERYISRFNLLASKAEFGMFRLEAN